MSREEASRAGRITSAWKSRGEAIPRILRISSGMTLGCTGGPPAASLDRRRRNNDASCPAPDTIEGPLFPARRLIDVRSSPGSAEERGDRPARARARAIGLLSPRWSLESRRVARRRRHCNASGHGSVKRPTVRAARVRARALPTDEICLPPGMRHTPNPLSTVSRSLGDPVATATNFRRSVLQGLRLVAVPRLLIAHRARARFAQPHVSRSSYSRRTRSQLFSHDSVAVEKATRQSVSVRE